MSNPTASDDRHRGLETEFRAPRPPMDDDALERWLNNYFAFWVICERGACKRNKRCAGEPRRATIASGRTCRSA